MKSMLRPLVVAGALVAVTAWVVVAQTELDERVERLVREGRYDLARDLVDDHERNGQTVSAPLRWVRARLEVDPDRFDRMALEASNVDPDPRRRVEATLARAREQFARGRYRTAVELLTPLAEAPDTASDGRILLWLGMAEQASGQVGAGLRRLRDIDAKDPSYATAQVLLADLALRGGRLEAAEEHARHALDADDAVGAMALSVLARVADGRGEAEAARSARDRLRRQYPRSPEAAWAIEAARAEAGAAEEPSAVPEIIDAERRSFALQLGAFRDRSLALRLYESSQGTLDGLRIEVDRSGEAPWYRVVGGEFVTRAQAEEAQRDLERRGVASLVLAPTRGG